MTPPNAPGSPSPPPRRSWRCAPAPRSSWKIAPAPRIRIRSRSWPGEIEVSW